jgi:hypothetical protein
MLVHSSGAGVIFESENPHDLAKVIERIAVDRSELDRITRNAWDFDSTSILPRTGAKYLVDVLAHHFYAEEVAPQSPWL